MIRRLITLFLCALLVTLSPFAISYYRRMFYRPYLTVMGFASMSDGIGRQSVEIMDAMKDVVSVGFHPSKKSKMEDVPVAVQKIMNKKKAQLGKVVIYEDIFYPFSYIFFKKRFDLNKQDQVRIAYSMFESSEIPKYWVYNLNLYFDAVVVPDPFLIDVYKNSGVTLPIFVVPLGLNLQQFIKEPLKDSFHTPFVFGNFSTCISRKNHHELIQAFHEAFGNNSDVVLWMNSRYTEEHLFDKLQQQIQDLGVDNILLTNDCPDSKEYLENFKRVDCYVSISQSEGFSIQPREAMALGIPCIVSDNTAQSTICKSGLVTAVPSPHQELAYYEAFREVFGYRYNIDFPACVEALRSMYDSRKNLSKDELVEKSGQLRAWASYYDYSSLRPLYKTLIKPRKVILGETNTLQEDVLITNSTSLYKKYRAIR